jgi:hypothetical protein
MSHIRAIRKLVFCTIVLAALAGAERKAKSSQPAIPDVSGTYSFLREGELIELNLQDGEVIGDIQRFGSGEARGVMLTHFFEKATLNKDRLEFTTKTVHGVYYHFKGKIVQGEGKTRADEDYYRMVGTLTEYTGDARKKISARKREVTFKSSPDEMLGEAAETSK